jgi:hypothetical protein
MATEFGTRIVGNKEIIRPDLIWRRVTEFAEPLSHHSPVRNSIATRHTGIGCAPTPAPNS